MVQKLKLISVVSVSFMLVEFLGGYLAHSVAIFADAFHLLTDVLAYMISLYSIIKSKQNAPPNLTFGYRKIQPLGALVNIAIIWVVTVELFIEATTRIITRQVVEEPFYMLLTSIFGLCCNLYIVKLLHGEGNHHHHEHSHPKVSMEDSFQEEFSELPSN